MRGRGASLICNNQLKSHSKCEEHDRTVREYLSRKAATMLPVLLVVSLLTISLDGDTSGLRDVRSCLFSLRSPNSPTSLYSSLVDDPETLDPTPGGTPELEEGLRCVIAGLPGAESSVAISDFSFKTVRTSSGEIFLSGVFERGDMIGVNGRWRGVVGDKERSVSGGVSIGDSDLGNSVTRGETRSEDDVETGCVVVAESLTAAVRVAPP